MEKNQTRVLIQFKGYPKNEQVDEDPDDLGKLKARGPRIVRQMLLNYKNVLDYDDDCAQSKDLPRPLEKLKLINALDISFPERYLESGIIFKGIFVKVKSLSSLQVLKLQFPYSNWISMEGIQLLASVLPQLKLLNKLTIDFKFGHWLDDETLSILFKSLKKSKALRSFHIGIPHCKNVTEKSFKSLASTFKPSLKELDLGVQGLNLKESNALDFLASGLTHLTGLQTLRMCFSKLQTSSIDALSPFISSIKHLKSLKILSLDFSYLPMKAPALKHLASSLEFLQHLHTLSLNFEFCSTFKVQEMEVLTECLQSVGSSLKNLGLNFNSHSLNDEVLQKLSLGLKALTKPSEIKLQCSDCPNVGDVGIESITYELGGLSNLRLVVLDFRGCRPIKDDHYKRLKCNGNIKSLIFLHAHL